MLIIPNEYINVSPGLIRALRTVLSQFNLDVRKEGSLVPQEDPLYIQEATFVISVPLLAPPTLPDSCFLDPSQSHGWT